MSFASAIDQLQAPAAPGTSEQASPERLKALAAQFESMLVSQMLQEMRASMFDEAGDKGMGAGPLADTLFAELSLAISRTGGIGLAESMMTPLQRQTGVPTAAPLAVAGSVTIGSASEGLDQPAAVPALSSMLNPATTSPSIAGRVSSAYGWRRDPLDESLKFHRGLDIAMPIGQDIPAPQAGKVTFAGEQAGYGLTVEVQHGDQLTTRYAHLSEITVRTGDEIAVGQIIAKSGATGRVTGPHLHFEVLEAGRSVNPAERLATYTAGRPQ